jgi:hypothetical protein
VQQLLTTQQELSLANLLLGITHSNQKLSSDCSLLTRSYDDGPLAKRTLRASITKLRTLWDFLRLIVLCLIDWGVRSRECLYGQLSNAKRDE